MFESLSDKLENVFRDLTGRGKIGPDDIKRAMVEVRRALIEADVNFRVVSEFIKDIEEEAVGEKVLSGLNPGQQVIKIVNDKLVELLGGESTGLNLTPPLTTIMVIGLQGTGKTTTIAKLANYLKSQGQRPLLVAGDIYRPAAITQLQTLGTQIGVPVYTEGTNPPPNIAQNAIQEARRNSNSVVIIDTAGRLQIDEPLMVELEEIKRRVKPTEILLVVDAMTGQEAVNVAGEFNRRVGITGILMTKMDGDARGGAALSVRAVTNVPIKFMTTGEKVDALEPFFPDRIASRILGMGDVLTLIEKAQQAVDEEEALRLQEKMKKGNFDLEDFLKQMRSIRKMGPLGGLLGLLPGVGKQMKELRNALETPEAERELKRTEAMITSMTLAERRNPELIDASRRRRIAKGSGTQVSDVNALLQQFRTMRQMMREMGRGGNMGMNQMIGGPGGMVNSRKAPPPRQVDPLAQFKGGRTGGNLPPKKKKK
jgi:signal recognition particle subunit SRP54